MNSLKNTLGTEVKIIDAAKKVFVTKGLSGARMQDIADIAGINKALLHYYFRSKEKLFENIFNQEAAKFFPRINMVFNSDLPLFEKIEQFVSEYIDELNANPYLPMFILSEINKNEEAFINKQWMKSYRPNPSKFIEQIKQEIKKGSIKPIEPLQLLMNMISLCVFPYLIKPLFKANLSLSDKAYNDLLEQRKKTVAQFIIQSIKK